MIIIIRILFMYPSRAVTQNITAQNTRKTKQ